MKQKIFIGSSREGQGICDAILTQLSREFEVEPWHISFSAGRTGIESLLGGLGNHNFGIFVMSADDRANVRGNDVILPRDNVIFEAGIFMGMHGLHHTFLVCPADIKNFHLLTDVGGVTRVNYDSKISSIDIAVAPVVQTIKQAIARANREMRNIKIEVRDFKKSKNQSITWPLKLQLKIRNVHNVPVTVHSISFDFFKARQATNDYVLGGVKHNVAFKRWITPGTNNHDQYHEVVYLDLGEEVDAWVAFDANHTDEEMSIMQKNVELGLWRYRTTWHDSVPKAYDHSKAF